jgi:SAM-dependent methyltransferase
MVSAEVRARAAAAGRTGFDALPPQARRWIRSALGRPGFREISLVELDRELDAAAALFERSEDDALAFLARLRLRVPDPAPADPFSNAYRAWAWRLYEAIAAKPYALENEATVLDEEAALARPYPFSTGSPAVVGDELEARAQVLRCLGTLGLRPPARLVEFGPGWGNLTVDLALTGFEVVAVDANEHFCRYLGRRARELGTLEVVHADMLDFRPADPADAAVFFECFHHCADHTALLEGLHEVVGPTGVLLFVGEPVHEMPYPWGPRLDGLSLWSMRRYGWLELGFDPAYFTSALRRAGWEPRWIRSRRLAGKAAICVARRV